MKLAKPGIDAAIWLAVVGLFLLSSLISSAMLSAGQAVNFLRSPPLSA